MFLYCIFFLRIFFFFFSFPICTKSHNNWYWVLVRVYPLILCMWDLWKELLSKRHLEFAVWIAKWTISCTAAVYIAITFVALIPENIIIKIKTKWCKSLNLLFSFGETRHDNWYCCCWWYVFFFLFCLFVLFCFWYHTTDMFSDLEERDRLLIRAGTSLFVLFFFSKLHDITQCSKQ